MGKKKSGKHRPGHNHKWVVVDEQGTVRAYIKNCPKAEAKPLAAVLFPEIGVRLRVLWWFRASREQRAAAREKGALTPNRCAAIGIPLPVDLRKGASPCGGAQ
jgi:hypothetical protein